MQWFGSFDQEAYLTQDGINNYSVQNQFGNTNLSTVIQTNNNNINFNLADSYQFGSGNVATITQTGN